MVIGGYMIKKYRKGFIFKKDILYIDGQEAVIETDRQVHTARFPTYRLEFFRIRGSFPAKYYIDKNKYCFKRPYSISKIESNGILYQVKWRKPYYRIYVGDQEIASIMVNTRNYGDISLACTDLKYKRICRELALAISLKKVDNQTFINQLWFWLMIAYILIRL